MARFRALFLNTWWLWLAFFIGGVVLSVLDLVFLFLFPLSIFVFIWFAYVRYDEDGKFKGS